MTATITEKIVHSDAFEVNLYKEGGVFWKAYEQSAYAIHQIRREYKSKKEYVKKVATQVVSIGFPDSALRDILSAFAVVGRNEKVINLKTREPIDLEAFKVWKEALPVFVPTCENCKIQDSMIQDLKMQNAKIEPLNSVAIESLNSETNSEAIIVYNKVRHLDLSNVTPMDCMTFLSELKKIV